MKPGSLSETLIHSIEPWIEVKKGFSLDKVLAELPREAAWRSACQSVLYGAVRKKALLQALIRKLASRKPAPKVEALLELALSQLIEGDVKAFTVCDQAVRAAKESPELRGAAGFINAILRRFLREQKALLEELNRDPVVRFNAPKWWIKRYEERFGPRTAEIFALQKKHPPLVLRVNERKTTVAEMLKRLEAAQISCHQEGKTGIRLDVPRAVKDIPGFAEGLVSVQDAGSQLAAVFLDAQSGMRVLDACAAPGGKTAHILERADANLTALEIDPKRAEKIHENLNRLGLEADIKVADASKTEKWWDGKPFDRILLDAPCTASGIVRRHPDIPWSRKSEDIAKLAATQSELLEKMWPLLAKRGRILYAVCSVFPEEGPRNIRHFCERHPDARLMPIGEPPETLLRLEPKDVVGKDASVFPLTHDGFFYALIEKI